MSDEHPWQPEFEAAMQPFRAGDRDEAERRLRLLLETWPDCGRAIAMLGVISAERGQPGQAEALFRRCVALEPANQEFLMLLGRLLARQRRAIEAAEMMERAAEAGVGGAALLVEAASARMAARQYDAAERDFLRAIEIEPAYPPAGSGLVLALAAQEKHEACVTAARSFAERCPDSAEAQARLALVLERMNRADEAAAPARRAVALDEESPFARFALGLVLQREGDDAGAAESLEAALQRSREPSDRQAAARALGVSLDRLGRCDEAYARFREAKEATGTVSPAVRQMTAEFIGFIEACARDLNAWSLASWPSAPEYLAFSTPPVFVCGFPRSGTTMFERMLASHPRFVTTDEHPSLSTLREHLQRHAGGADKVPLYLGALGEPEIRTLRAIYFNEIEKHLTKTKKDPASRRLVDRNPINLAHLAIAKRLFPDAPVIVCLRDPRDAVLSAFMKLANSPAASIYFTSIEGAAEYYARVMGLWLHFRAVLDVRFLELRYEDLVASPEAERRRVCTFLGEPFDPAMWRFDEASKGELVRSPGSSLTKPLTEPSIGRWRSYRSHFGGALEVLKPFVEAFGYDPS